MISYLKSLNGEEILVAVIFSVLWLAIGGMLAFCHREAHNRRLEVESWGSAVAPPKAKGR